jgi:hypothetical protein
VLDVSGWPVTAEEPAGADEKIWLTDPGTQERWLFKPVTVKSGHTHGEDWAEKVGTELGALLGIPCAQVEMAVRDGAPGALSLNLRPNGYELHSGAVPLSGLVRDYIPGAENPVGRPGHSLANIRRVLDGAEPPPGAQLPAGFTAFDTFAGMLLLDAWIANRDRHDENWSVLRPHDPQAPTRLCGAYDQAGCLGYNLRDSHRIALLNGNQVEAWALKGTAWRFEHSSKPPTLVTLAAQALTLASPSAQPHWLGALRGVADDTIASLLNRVPGLSDPARTFANEVLGINRGRLFDECR